MTKFEELYVEIVGNDRYLLDSYLAKKLVLATIEECISACATDKLGKTVSAEELIKERFGLCD